MERRGHHQWLADLNREYPDEVPAETLPTRPPEARHESWHDFYRRAWQTLRYDRHYTEGGQKPITFLAYDAYARRYSIEGDAFDRFIAFMSAIDDEWLLYLDEQRKEAAT